MPLYDKFGNNVFDFGRLAKDAKDGIKDLFGNKQAEAEAFMKKQQEQAAAFKANQEKNRKAKNFQAVKETDLQTDDPVFDFETGTDAYNQKMNSAPNAAAEREREDRWAAELGMTEDLENYRTSPERGRERSAFTNRKIQNAMAKKGIGTLEDKAAQAQQDEKVAAILAQGEPGEADIKAWYDALIASKKPTPEATETVETVEEEEDVWPPVSEPVRAGALAPTEETAAATRGNAAIRVPEDTVRANTGNLQGGKYGNIVDEAYKQRMADYELELADAQRKRDVIDRAYEMQQKGYDYFENQFNAANAKDNGEEGAGWGSPFGLLGGIGKAFYGRAVYNPKTGRFEQKAPKSWEELGTNLFRNLATIGSGLKFSAGRNGRGGTSFSMDYDWRMPAAMINSYRENQYRPYGDYEDLQRKLANEYIGKPWQFDEALPRAKHPFEKEMLDSIAEDISTQTTLRKADQMAEIYGIEKGSDAYQLLLDHLYKYQSDIAPYIREYARRIDESGLYDDKPELKEELIQAVAAKLLDVDDVLDRRATRELNAQRVENEQMLKAIEQDRKEREFELKQRQAQTEEEVKKSQIRKNEAYIAGKGNIKTNVIKYDKDGKEIEIAPYNNLVEVKDNLNKLRRLYDKMEDGTIPKTPETLKAWAEMYDEFFAKASGVKDAQKVEGWLEDIEDKTTGNVKKAALANVREDFDELYQSLVAETEQARQEEEAREARLTDTSASTTPPTPAPGTIPEQPGKPKSVVNTERKALEKREDKTLPAEQKDLARKELSRTKDRHQKEEESVLKEAFVHASPESYKTNYGNAPVTEVDEELGGTEEPIWYNYYQMSETKPQDVAKYVALNKSQNSVRYQLLAEAFNGIKERLNMYMNESQGVAPDPKVIRRIEFEEVDKALNDYEKGLIGFNTWGNSNHDEEKNNFILDDYVNSLLKRN